MLCATTSTWARRIAHSRISFSIPIRSRSHAQVLLSLRVRSLAKNSYPRADMSTATTNTATGCESSSSRVVDDDASTLGSDAIDIGSRPAECVEITEGRASILFPNSNEVFYNPVQEFNRDLSIAVIKHYSEHMLQPSNKKKKREIKSNVNKTDSDQDAGMESKSKDDLPCDSDSNRDNVKSIRGISSTDSDTGQEDSTGQEQAAVDGAGREEGVVDGARKEEGVTIEGNGMKSTGRVDEAGMDGSHAEPSGVKVLEALAASGLRSIRYALEVPRLESVVANDFSQKAYHSICQNVAHNSVGSKVKPSWREASMLMYEHREPHTERFDVIDLDPYGSPCQFLDSTVQSVKDGGLLCITCTDMSVLCGTHSESCHSKYGAMSLKAKYCHEMALRIVLANLESHANRYRRYIVPLLSCSVDFYIRLFVRVYTSAQEVKRSPSKLSMVYQCIGCESFHFQQIGKRIEEGRSRKYPPATGPPVDRHCDQCGSIFKLGGPMWSEPIHDKQFVDALLSDVKTAPSGMYRTLDRIKGLLTVVSEELQDVPLYYVLDSICSTMHCNTPKMLAFRSAILDQGYRVSISHANANAIKTDAPHHVLWDILRCWVKISSIKEPGEHSPAAAILKTEPKIKASFDIRKDANPPSRLLKLSRFPDNPEANWGPKARAKRKGDNSATEELITKRQRLQGKRTK